MQFRLVEGREAWINSSSCLVLATSVTTLKGMVTKRETCGFKGNYIFINLSCIKRTSV